MSITHVFVLLAFVQLISGKGSHPQNEIFPKRPQNCLFVFKKKKIVWLWGSYTNNNTVVEVTELQGMTITDIKAGVSQILYLLPNGTVLAQGRGAATGLNVGPSSLMLLTQLSLPG
jgi:hypothetical protein